jgi:hypothetical protein
VSRVSDAEAYAERRYTSLPGLIPADRASTLAALARRLPGRMVTLGDGNSQRWEERQVDDEEHPIRILLGTELVETVLRIVRPHDRAPGLADFRCWVTRYGTGGFLPRHRDRYGTAQLVICLAVPPAENGGLLGLQAPGCGEEHLQLGLGDAVVLDATAVDHWTTPLITSERVPEPERLAAVGRYYVE